MVTGNRRQARELALKIIYSFPDQPGEIEQVMTGFWRNFHFNNDILGEAIDEPAETLSPVIRTFAEQVARGTYAHLEKIDACVESYSANWSLERMSRVDLALLRLGVFELLEVAETPASVIINEAIEIGKRYGTKETPAFVNGILDKVAKNERS